MFWRRKNDGFKWVAYVPTQLKARRQQRRDRLVQARIEVLSMSRDMIVRAYAAVLDKSKRAVLALWAGSEWLVATLVNGAIALFSLSLLAAHAVWGHVSGILEPLIIALWRWSSGAIATIARSPLLRLAGFVGVLIALGGALKALSLGLDRESRIALLAGSGLALIAALPAVYRCLAPGLAQFALEALKTRRAGVASKRRMPATARHWPVTQALVIRALAALGILAAVGAGGTWAFNNILKASTLATGSATVVTAEILRVGTNELKLAGIAAPEPAQSCGEGARRWRCGEAAQRALEALVRGKSWSCSTVGRDSAGRPLAQCFDNKTDLAATLVERGHVWSDLLDTRGYRALEATARAAKTGVWRTSAAPPWEWRDQLWETAKRQAPEGCPIKGEVSAGTRIYHMPWSPAYDRVRISRASARAQTVDRPRRWFCSEQEAIDAGFRLAQGR